MISSTLYFNNSRCKPLAIIFLLPALLFACNKGQSTSVNSDSDNPPDNPPSQFMQLAFTVTCYSRTRDRTEGTVANVMIFDQETGVRQVSGGTLPDGSFCSIMKLDRTKSYRIEILDPANGKCVISAWGFTYENQPNMWVDKCSNGGPNSFHLGTCGDYFYETQCWGD